MNYFLVKHGCGDKRLRMSPQRSVCLFIVLQHSVHGGKGCYVFLAHLWLSSCCFRTVFSILLINNFLFKVTFFNEHSLHNFFLLVFINQNIFVTTYHFSVFYFKQIHTRRARIMSFDVVQSVCKALY